ncbi:GAF domain-containing protein [Falsiroseomonas sp.]|uniref:GAF domain-containing protein n=1 Tax=Falsiroseomonas sp. TaxID=2870721 RepID=UPI003F72C0A6
MTADVLAEGLAMLERAGAEALAAPGPEAAMRALARGCFDLLGDRGAHLRPGALKPGERDYYIAGSFFLTPDGQYHMLVGNIGFPAEQERLMVPVDGGHPGWVFANRRKLLLENTDEHGSFRQYLKTSKMGSSIFAPILFRGEFHGMLIMAAQARYALRPVDLSILAACAQIAAGAWIAQGGPEWLAGIYPPANAFRVNREGVS